MVEKQMKTFTAGDTKYIINDAEARAEVADLKSAINELDEDVFGQNIPITTSGYISLKNATADVTSPISSASYKCTVVSCVAGNKFVINGGSSGEGARLYGFVGSDGTVLEVASRDAAADNLIITAPENTAYLVINDYLNDSGTVTCKTFTGLNAVVARNSNAIEDLQTSLEAVDESIASFEDAIETLNDEVSIVVPQEIEITEAGYISTNVTTIDVTNPKATSDIGHYKHIVIPCVEGDTFTAYGNALGVAAVLYTFTDESYNVLDQSPASDSVQYYYLTAPENSAYVLFQRNDGHPNRAWHGISIDHRFEMVNEKIEEAEEDINDRIEAIEDEIDDIGAVQFQQNLQGWTNRGIVPGTGVINSNSKRLLTQIPYTALSCGVDSGYSFLVFGWNGDTYLGWYTGTDWSKNTMTSRTTELDLSNIRNYTLYAILVHGTTTGTAVNIDVSEGVHFYTKNTTDALLTTKNAPADAYAVSEKLQSVKAETISSVKTITGSEVLNPSTYGYLNTSGSTVDPTSVNTGPNIYHGVFDCSPGEEFTVEGSSPGSVAGYCVFVDASYNVLRSESTHAAPTLIEAPASSAHVILQRSGSGDYLFIRGRWTKEEIEILTLQVDHLSGQLGGYRSQLYYTSDDSQELVTSYTTLISMYDALVTANPNYITKNTLTDGNFSNYEYVFSMGQRNNGDGQRAEDSPINKPVALITAGTHGHERCSIMGLYLFAKALCDSPELSAIRNGLTIKMIPVVCPSGYNNNSRVNANGVNINRNYDANWVQTPDDGMNYSGAAPADQPETRIVQSWLEDNENAAIMIDWHNSAYTNEICYFATCIADGFAVNAKKGYFYGIDRITGHWINDREIVDSNTIYGYTGVDSANGTFYAYTKKMNLNGCLFETSWNVGNYGKDSAETIGVNAEAFCAAFKGIVTKYIDVI